jgi:hypothetical protein
VGAVFSPPHESFLSHLQYLGNILHVRIQNGGNIEKHIGEAMFVSLVPTSQCMNMTIVLCICIGLN